MKRLPLVASFLLFIALCASLAYWSMQLFKPPLRPVAAPPRSAQPEIRTEAAATLLGGRNANVAVASNYQLKGVIFSGSPRNSVAILSADGKPPQAVRVDMEIAPGVKVAEVHREYVLLSEGGTSKRVELPEGTKGQGTVASVAPVPVRPAPAAQAQPIPSRAQAAASGAGGSQAHNASPIPQGNVPSVHPPPATPPTVVVSPAPGMQSNAQAAAQPPAVPQPAVPLPAAPPVAVPPSAASPAMQGATPVRPPPSSDTAPLISR